MKSARSSKARIADDIVRRLLRRHSTATVLFHQSVAEHLGLGPADHKCLDVLRERGPMIGRELAAMTGLTSGAVTGIVARLEQAGFVRRVSDPDDQRKVVITVLAERMHELQTVFGPMRDAAAALLDGFNAAQLAAISTFLDRSTEFMYQRAALMRARETLQPASKKSIADHSTKRTRGGLSHSGRSGVRAQRPRAS